ncbi:dihydrolipoyllysine-residue succinyltransferase component of 2-oxoglutarate dehydrogenase complex, mitochondrial [Eurytemora carolleeae]|uniref:dihydrolipoyllysine-residue succinyltransferase component of 2-oxoglutarate dehydrogenase complex, mitochondrial n=1 Tax=Eurytemora carolleeae TaxID=1294199 RepID=UPI000C791813|nr:dihydrolipoyllysine-residue succinyltransferase component of 2-oxoglutarate dehydrogenase complex, mitochondrial [Eurytemora carolleeae]|eukprot:XP_023336382.1 dihydrolipoyllysine-residue succinyltransferase component of 2-oxoglutarate dehydrogenase complex, mitochondrial-like [Eurytemora affinis]
MLASRNTLRGLRAISTPLNRSLHKGPVVCSKLLEQASSTNLNKSECRVLVVPRSGLHVSRVLGNEIKDVVCPPFADSISEGDVRWEKAVGDSISVDEVICNIETDKTSVPVPSSVSGVIAELLVEDGSTVSPGTVLLKIKVGAAGAAPPKKEAAAPAPAAPAPAAAAPPPPSPAPAAAAPIPSTPPPPPPVPAAPISSRPPPAPMPARPSAGAAPMVKMPPADPTKEIVGTRSEHRVKMNRMRLKIAARLKEAQNTNAMLTTFNELDMSGIMQLRKDNQDAFVKRHGIKMGFMSAFVKASAYALQQQPTVNAVIDGQDIIYRDYVDISVAVATPKGLVVPVLRNVQEMNYADIEKGIAELGAKAKKNAITVEDMDGGSFTISNGGVFGSLFGTPIINPPQSAILGMHGVFERPVVRNGQVTIRPMMYIALTYDHRLVDGREAVTFLRTIKTAVEDPRSMLMGL